MIIVFQRDIVDRLFFPRNYHPFDAPNMIYKNCENMQELLAHDKVPNITGILPPVTSIIIQITSNIQYCLSFNLSLITHLSFIILKRKITYHFTFSIWKKKTILLLSFIIQLIFSIKKEDHLSLTLLFITLFVSTIKKDHSATKYLFSIDKKKISSHYFNFNELKEVYLSYTYINFRKL